MSRDGGVKLKTAPRSDALAVQTPKEPRQIEADSLAMFSTLQVADHLLLSMLPPHRRLSSKRASYELQRCERLGTSAGSR